jgi:transposase
MKAYPIELRQRIVDAVDRQFGTIEQIAKIFEVTERYIYQLLALRRETGALSPRPHGGGAKAKLDGRRLQKLAELSAAQPDATLRELRERLNRRQRTKLSISTVFRGLNKLDQTQKKVPSCSRSRSRRACGLREKTNDSANPAALGPR